MGRFENNRLTPTKPDTGNDKFATYDIEAQKWNQFLMGGFYDGTEYYHHETVDSLCKQMLQRKYEGYHIYAHYGGGYDHRFILDWILKNRPDLKILIIENHGNILALKVFKTTFKNGVETPKNVWHFWDSYQVLKGSLKDLTNTFKVKHRKKSDVNAKYITDTPTAREYLKYDCYGLYEVIDEFYKLPMLSGIGHKMTTSSLAMSTFRLKYLKDTILYKLTPEKEDFVRQGYYGGRTEIFKMVAKNVREYDVNSMYVSAMLNPLPMGSKGSWVTDFDFTDKNTVGFLECEVNCPDHLHIPILPYKSPEGKLIFPTGQWTGVYYSEEIKEALKYGYEIKVKRALIFPCSPFLAKYAQDTWNIRIANPGKNPVNITAKLLGNGLYGKFAQQREREMLVMMDFEEGCQAGHKLVFPEYDLWKVPTFSDSPMILPYISAAITSHSRIALHRYLMLKPEAVVYCDTDSVFIEDEELPHGEGLGDLKFEEHYKRFAAIQPKFYYAEPYQDFKTSTVSLPVTISKTLPGGGTAYLRYSKYKYFMRCTKKDKVRAKGFSGDELPFIYDDFTESLKTNDYSIFFQQQEEKMTKLNEALKLKDILALVARKKGVKSVYDKRAVNRENWTTKPVNITFTS